MIHGTGTIRAVACAMVAIAALIVAVPAPSPAQPSGKVARVAIVLFETPATWSDSA